MCIPKKIVQVVLICACLHSVSFGEQNANSSQAGSRPTVSVTDPSLKAGLDKGLPLTTVSNVSDQAAVEAVLIPASLARRIFGKEVAHNYAVVELTVANKDSKAALIVQSVFLDYSQWLLSGLSQQLPPDPKLEATQKASKPWQVASVESRLVRGELLDAQQWTARNWTIRSLTAVGSVAAAFEFPYGADFARGVAAFQGSVVPGASVLWPDGTVNQINRISDVGFQTNKIIPKQSSDIIVAFFPISRFLTPGFRKIFIKNPSGFFVPGELLTDPEVNKNKKLMDTLLPLFKQIDSNISETTMASAATAAFLATCPSDKSGKDAQQENPATTAPASNSTNGILQLNQVQSCQLRELMSRVSLNSVRVVVGGVMTVDIASIPATIHSLSFKETDATKLWAASGDKQRGTITGAYLSGGTPYIVDSNGVPVPNITLAKIDASSNDTKLVFDMTVSKCLPSDKKYFLVVTKDNGTSSSSDNSSSQDSDSPVSGVVSTPFELSVPPLNCDSGSSQNNSSAGGNAPNTANTTPSDASKAGTPPTQTK